MHHGVHSFFKVPGKRQEAKSMKGSSALWTEAKDNPGLLLIHHSSPQEDRAQGTAVYLWAMTQSSTLLSLTPPTTPLSLASFFQDSCSSLSCTIQLNDKELRGTSGRGPSLTPWLLVTLLQPWECNFRGLAWKAQHMYTSFMYISKTMVFDIRQT